MFKIRSIYKSLIKLVLSLITALFVFFYLNSNSGSFENLAMGTQTSPYQARNERGNPIHFFHLDSVELDQLDSLVFNNDDSALVFLGNSQTHSINQKKEKECNYVELLSRNLQDPCVAFTFPNANLQEFLLTLDYTSSKLKIKKVCIPIFMDDLREDGIREVFFPELFKRKYQIVNKSLVSEEINLSLRSGSGSEKTREKHVPTPQDNTEKFLNTFLNENTIFWPMRETMRGNLFNWLYMLRNTILGIRPGTVRPMILKNYKNNFTALEHILDYTHANNIEVYLYIPPIRSDVPLPYDILEMKKFKLDLNRLVEKYPNSSLKDYSAIVPGRYWGYKDPTNFIDKREVDFMHFQYDGHKILADSLIKYIR